jgi:inhibitor of KinA sporulation pathway (predicted exonuclease)
VDYIVLDIEFNGRKFASELPMEVIEIGAVRLDSSLQFVDEFSSLIKPVYYAKLNSFIKKKTGIPQEDIDEAEGFVKIIQRFIQWLNMSESFLLLTWGGEDLKRIVYDTRMHKLDDTFWMAVNYYDLLKGYLRFRNVTNDVSVDAALTDLGITAEGNAHRALDDARMTAEVFRATFSKLDLERVQQYKDLYSNARERKVVKQAIRSLVLQKKTPTWELIVERYLKDKVKLDDPRKAAELEAYFEAEKDKAPQPAQASQAPSPSP